MNVVDIYLYDIKFSMILSFQTILYYDETNFIVI